MPASIAIPFHSRGSRTQSLRAAVLEVPAQSAQVVTASLRRFREKDWIANLHWLDTSGLALYLLHHLTQLDCTHLLPPLLLTRLEQNLADNRARNADLLAEACELNIAFQRSGIEVVNCKGFTLFPDSVPDPALRCQLDLDFTLAAEHADTASRLLQQRGYRLDCVCGDTWEFRAGTAEPASIQDLYKSKPQRSIDLHLVTSLAQLGRLETRTFAGTSCPVLAPPNIFLAQAMHLFKHLRSPFTRASWLLELRQHMITRAHDSGFWIELKSSLQRGPQTIVAVSATILLVQEIFTDSPSLPFDLAPVSPSVALWISLYGRASLLADFPGTKLYLLLQQELEQEQTPLGTTVLQALREFFPHVRVFDGSRRQTHYHVLPLALPRMITDGHRGNALSVTLRRYRSQLSFVLSRLRFHFVEGSRYLIESTRFRRLLTGLLP